MESESRPPATGDGSSNQIGMTDGSSFNKNPQLREGSQRMRPVPDGFEQTFILIGRFDCQEHYRARRETITAWLEQIGKARLIAARKEHVAAERRAGRWMTRQTRLVDKRPRPAEPVEPPEPADPELDAIARRAAHFLRTSLYGGWRVSRAPDGGWFVGTVRRTSERLIEMAERQGFVR